VPDAPAPARVGKLGLFAGFGAAAGLAAIAAAVWLLLPVRGWIANIQDEGEVGKILAMIPGNADRLDERVAGVRERLRARYDMNRAFLDAIDRDTPRSPLIGLRRLEVWSDFKYCWAGSLHEFGLRPERFFEYAATHPDPVDRLLLPPTPTATTPRR
jgi:hypothetical protein